MRTTLLEQIPKKNEGFFGCVYAIRSFLSTNTVHTEIETPMDKEDERTIYF